MIQSALNSIINKTPVIAIQFQIRRILENVAN